jgi:hypothetical protein
MRTSLRWRFALLAAVLVSSSAIPPAFAGSSTTSTTSTGGPYAGCLQEVPYDVKIGLPPNASVSDYAATFPNGTEVIYPYTSCVRPVYPNLYGVVLAIGDNPRFIALENGSLYSFSTIGSANPFLLQNLTTGNSSCKYGSTVVPGGAVECYAGEILSFFLYNGRILNGCGSPYPDFSGWIQVQVPVNSTTGQLDTANIVAEQLGPFNGQFLCTTQTTLPQTTTTTVTITPTTTVTITPTTTITMAPAQNVTSEVTVFHRNEGTFPAALLAGLLIVSGAIAFIAIVTLRRAKTGPKSSP